MVARRRSRRRIGAGGGPPSVASAVGRFMLGSLVALAVVLVGGFFALRSVTIHEAERDTAERVQAEARLVEALGITDGLLRHDPDSIARIDEVVQSQVLAGSIVRVKLWSENGTVLYSDEPALIGQRFTLGDEERELLTTGGSEAELSDLSQPENRYERQESKLLEAHAPIRTPNGTPVLFEIYQRFSSVSASGERLLGALAPPILGGLLVLALFQVPLAWSLARSLQGGHREREALLANAIEASAQERRRIASDLHDGVVQDLAGVAFGLAPLAEEADRRGAAGDARVLRESMARLRQGVRDLRTLLVEIHPPSLESTGLEPALNDLLSPLQHDGIETELLVDDEASGGSVGDALVYRVAREALRNVQKYADADSVRVAVTRAEPGLTRLVVEDDGRGFSSDDRARRRQEGHVGLTLLEGLVQQSNGRLAVISEPGKGTKVELEVPAQ